MKLIYKIITIALTLIFISVLSADENEYDAIYLNMVKEYKLNTDGTVTYHHSHEIKLLSYFAFTRRYGETFIVYDTLYQNFKSKIKSVTTMADGKKVTSPANAFNLVLPRYANNAPAFNHLREMVVTHTGIENNSVVELDYTMETKPGFIPGLMLDEVLALDAPIKDLTLRVFVPENQHVNFKLLNNEVDFKQNQGNGSKIFTWHLKDLLALPPERMQASEKSFAPTLMFSTIKDLNEAFNHLLVQDAFQSDKVESLEKFVTSLKQEGEDGIELILKIQNIVAKEVAIHPVPNSIIGYRCRPANIVWESNGGTPLEKSILLAKFLNIAGVEAKPVLFSNSPFGDDFPAVLQSFEKSLVQVKIQENKIVYLPVDKPVEKDQKYLYSGQRAIILNPNGIDTFVFPAQDAMDNKSQMLCEINIDDLEKLSGRANVKLSGALNPYLNLIRDDKSSEKMIKSVLSGAEIKNSKTKENSMNSSEIEADFELSKPFKNQDQYLFWELPQHSLGIASLHLSDLSTQRNTPLNLSYPLVEENRFIINLGKNLRPVIENKQIKKNNIVGEITITNKIEKERLIVERNIQINKTVIKPAEYEAFLELWRLWAAPKNWTLILKKS